MNQNPAEQEICYVREALYRFNEEVVGKDGHQPLNIVEYGEDGSVIGVF